MQRATARVSVQKAVGGWRAPVACLAICAANGWKTRCGGAWASARCCPSSLGPEVRSTRHTTSSGMLRGAGGAPAAAGVATSSSASGSPRRSPLPSAQAGWRGRASGSSPHVEASNGAVSLPASAIWLGEALPADLGDPSLATELPQRSLSSPSLIVQDQGSKRRRRRRHRRSALSFLNDLEVFD